MSLNKAIKTGKEKRNPYRNHNAGCGKYCKWCIEDRSHSTRKRMEQINARLKEAGLIGMRDGKTMVEH